MGSSVKRAQSVILNSMEGAEQALFRAIATSTIWDICTRVLPKSWMDQLKGYDDISVVVAVEKERVMVKISKQAESLTCTKNRT